MGGPGGVAALLEGEGGAGAEVLPRYVALHERGGVVGDVVELFGPGGLRVEGGALAALDEDGVARGHVPVLEDEGV